MSADAMPNDLASRITRLLALTPDSMQAQAEQAAIESELMAALSAGGREAGEALILSLAQHGYEVVSVPITRSFWRVDLPPPRVLEFWFNPDDDPFIAAMSYRDGKPKGTPAQIRAAARHKAFYQRYEKLIADEESEIAALSPDDRLVLVIGEFEADVANGGFGQYLENKDLEQAQRALRYLTEIGAKRTAGWLSSALEASGDSVAVERLDHQFFNNPQDLASLVIRHLTRSSGG